MSVQDDAIKILDGIEEISRNQMLVRGTYITDVVDQDLAAAHSICGGRQACMVGSMWIAAGVWIMHNGEMELPGVTIHKMPNGSGIVYSDYPNMNMREIVLTTRPDLKLAYDTMNEVSFDHPKAQGIGLNPVNAMEDLFERPAYEDDEDGGCIEFGPLLTDDDLFDILDTARDRIRAYNPLAPDPHGFDERILHPGDE